MRVKSKLDHDLCSAAGIDLQGEADAELARVMRSEVIAKIRRKQAMKRGVVSHAAEAALPGEWQADAPLPSPPTGDSR